MSKSYPNPCTMLYHWRSKDVGADAAEMHRHPKEEKDIRVTSGKILDYVESPSSWESSKQGNESDCARVCRD